MSEVRMIDANALKERNTVIGIVNGQKMKVIPVNVIDNAPTVEERPKGEWLLRNSGCIQWIRCSICNKHQDYRATTNFCPNCGASMVRGEKE